MATHRTAFRVYYEDTDAGGVMYHAQYLAFAERGRSEALRDAGGSVADLLDQHGVAFVVRRLSIDYRRPLRLDALVTVETGLLEQRGASLRLRQSLSAGDVIAATLDVTLAVVRLHDLRPVRLPPRWVSILGSLED